MMMGSSGRLRRIGNLHLNFERDEIPFDESPLDRGISRIGSDNGA